MEKIPSSLQQDMKQIPSSLQQDMKHTYVGPFYKSS